MSIPCKFRRTSPVVVSAGLPAGYDRRKVEARFNTLPMPTTSIDGFDVQLIQARSRQ